MKWESLGECVYPDGQAPSLLLLEKVARRPDVEGTPDGIAVLK